MNIPDLTYWYWLRGIKGIGPARAKALLDEFGTPERIYSGTLDDFLTVPSVGKELAKAIVESKKDLEAAHDLCEKEAAIAGRIGAHILTLADSKYPSSLQQQVAVAPPLLYVRGTLDLLTDKTVAIVGTRHPSPEGRHSALQFARHTARAGWQVVGGLAAGIDAAGHWGALESGGYTIAVLGCGVDRVYPPENRKLFDAIIEKGGALVSEYPFGTPAKGDNLRRRNRIIVALSKAIVIAECPNGSGTLIAAEEAFEQAKPVFAFPFVDNRESARGSQALLTKGDGKALDQSEPWQKFSDEIDRYYSLKICILFDLDGVLADTIRLTARALSQAVQIVDGTEPSKEAVSKVVNLSPRVALTSLSRGDANQLHHAFNQYWQKNYAKDLVPHPQLRHIIERLQQLGMPLGVVTSRNREQANLALEALKLKHLFDEVTTWGDTTQHKPHPAPILHALSALPSVQNAVYVGDRAEDIVAARTAGLLSIAALWFAKEDAQITVSGAQPDFSVIQPSALFETVMQVRRQEWAKQRSL